MYYDYNESCYEIASDVFQVLNKRRYPKEYAYAKKMYIDLLQTCCCFALIDNGREDDSDVVAEKMDSVWKEDYPITFTVCAYQMYTNYKIFKSETFDDRSELDCEREYYGGMIGNYIFDDYLNDYQYIIIKKELWDGFVNCLCQRIKGHK